MAIPILGNRLLSVCDGLYQPFLKSILTEEIRSFREITVKNQFVSFYYWLLAVVHALLSNPQRVRLVLTVVVVCLVLAALLVPTLTTLADHIGGTGG